MTRARSLSQLANSNVFSVDANNSRVGIGSTVPTVKLDVGGDMNVSGTLTYEDVTNVETTGIVTAAQLVVTGVGATFAGISTFLGDIQVGDKIIHNGDTNTAIRFPAADTFTVETAGSERLRVNSSGRVGVNTDIIERNLVVSGGTAEGVIQITNTTSGGSQANGFELIHFTSGETQLLNRENGAMRFDTNGTERLRIASNGLIGINTNDPKTRFHIHQSKVANAPARTAALYLENNANCEIQMVGNASNDCQVRFGTGGSSFKGAIEYQLDNDALLAYVDGSERLRITSAGNVSIQNDSGKFTAGAGDDLQIYHNGNNFIEATNGSLFIRGSDLVLEDAGGNDYITCSDGGTGGTVTLKHLGSAKLTTSSTGVTVTGTLNATTDVTINGKSAATTGKAIAMAMLFG